MPSKAWTRLLVRRAMVQHRLGLAELCGFEEYLLNTLKAVTIDASFCSRPKYQEEGLHVSSDPGCDKPCATENIGPLLPVFLTRFSSSGMVHVSTLAF